MKLNLYIVTMAVLMLGACGKEPVVDQVNVDKIAECAFGKDGNKQMAACSQLNATEKRIMACASPKGVSRRVACKGLSSEELHFIPQLDAMRPVGTHFDLTIRKPGK
ncbi:hypothetical protein [Methylovorus glucosotrophus]|uniref:Lipoprotein n=1 Tax=Methylovorus glucosotrophus (strain SIP3-4) TaxID=582744 RepID=C6XA74_METGS|nr:hypothetical protein [Methylovorus glucosotrophus]ACT51615.1 hypothetical protein Msip34_2375 [Methylovorus glucosotrophus SIP3-4]